MRAKEMFIENALAYSLKQGADHCEIYALNGNHQRIVYHNGVPHDVQMADAQGFSVRLIKNDVLGFSYGTLLERTTLENAIDSAILSCKFLSPERDVVFAPGNLTYSDLPDQVHVDIPLEKKEAFLKEMAAAAGREQHILKTDNASFTAVTSGVMIKNTLGLDVSYENAYYSASLVAVAEGEGSRELGSDFMIGHHFDSLDAEKIGRNAAFDGVEKLGAITAPTGEYPVILHPKAVLDLLSIILPSFLGDNIRKGQSKLIDKMGKRIAHSDFCLYDDGLYKEAVSSCAFDDQGIPTQKTALIEHGIVTSFLYDLVSAKKAGENPTGNGYTSSHKGLPRTGISAFYVARGKTPLNAMVEGIEKGIFIKDLLGLHTANSVSGDFSLGIRGHLIEKGEKAAPIRGNMVAGNVFDLLLAIEEIGDDFTFYGYRGAPTLKIKSLKISGKS